MIKLTSGVFFFTLGIIVQISVNIVITNFVFLKFLTSDKFKSPIYQFRPIQIIPFNIPVLLTLLVYQGLSFLSIFCLIKSKTTNPGYLDRSEQCEKLNTLPTIDNAVEFYKNNKNKIDKSFVIKALQFIFDNPTYDLFPQKMIGHCPKCQIQQKIKKIQNQNKDQQQGQEYQFYWKPKRAHHCSQCKKCVLFMDHHCMWVNNCIGINNFKIFFLFNVYTFIYSFFSAVGCGIGGYLVLESDYLPENDDYQAKICYGLYLILALFFMVFTLFFIQDLLASIEINQTEVEKEKKLRGCHLNYWVNFKKVMGPNFFLWIVPIQQEYNVNLLELLYTEEQVEKEKKLSRFNQTYIENRFNDQFHPLYDFYQYYNVHDESIFQK